ncbi:hypothetical protein CERSUDRAFT_119016 [Gelatoporia subvermispora B]|uniref:Vacuolar sorting protein 39/Transforming growth factor beta receptor-associated domain-containing protein n=1 Tax=Ceriporiopsis subvermispora (strain B) TaxID=914234 RepID=M2R251_CERS8|nr:hypothetical protein CERSUDRAFT_119016 [Gelatoporia subvermispora B]
MRPPAFPRANVLVLGPDTIQSLLPSTLISQAEALLDNHRIEDAVDLADQQRKKLQSMVIVDDHEADELRYVYQRIGFQCLIETLFDDAGKHLFSGELDPRVLISYYPDLRGNLFSNADDAEVFAGVAEHMPSEASIDDIIAANLVRNYSPHLSPNTREAPPAVELRGILSMAAKEMLEVYLRKWRKKLSVEGGNSPPKLLAISTAVDTVLAKLYAESDDKANDMRTLLSEPNEISLPEVEPVFRRSRRYQALCELYHQRGEDNKLLEAWSRFADGEWTDQSIQDPASKMFALLTEKRDRALVHQWGIWFATRDPERSLKLLTSLLSGKRKVEEDGILLQHIQETNAEVGARFLEHLVLHRRSMDPKLHQQLAVSYVEQLMACLQDDQTSKLWRAKAASYASSNSDTPFISYFASTTPDSDPKRVRLKAALFLQGSSLYDPATIREKLMSQEKLLKLELAVLAGKLEEHRAALTILVHDMRDATSAEAYCTLGGEVVPAKIAQTLGERYGLQPWAALLLPPTKSRPGASAMQRQRTVDAGLKKSLIRILLEVYMSGGEVTADRTARFLNAQAMNLDVVDVLELIPAHWPLRILSNFLERSFRRTLHVKHEGQILKAISAGQNLTIAERTWLFMREQGADIEEALEDDEDGGADQGAEEAEAEKGVPMSFDEKVLLPVAREGQGREGDVVPIDIGVVEGLSHSAPDSDLDSSLR